MIKVNNKVYNDATTYDYDNLIIDKRRDSIKIVCSEDITQVFQNGIEWYKSDSSDSEDPWTDMSSYSKKVFSGKDELLGTYIVIMSKWTDEELLESMIEDLMEA